MNKPNGTLALEHAVLGPLTIAATIQKIIFCNNRAASFQEGL